MPLSRAASGDAAATARRRRASVRGAIAASSCRRVGSSVPGCKRSLRSRRAECSEGRRRRRASRSAQGANGGSGIQPRRAVMQNARAPPPPKCMSSGFDSQLGVAGNWEIGPIFQKLGVGSWGRGGLGNWLGDGLSTENPQDLSRCRWVEKLERWGPTVYNSNMVKSWIDYASMHTCATHMTWTKRRKGPARTHGARAPRGVTRVEKLTSRHLRRGWC
eukprot:COSAG02_NODE_5415_length_4348_cov_2.023770_6_plen_218_part_00